VQLQHAQITIRKRETNQLSIGNKHVGEDAEQETNAANLAANAQAQSFRSQNMLLQI
jgi:hypothetical protein